MNWTSLLPLAIPAMVLALTAVAQVAGSLSTQAETKQASRVGRIEAAVSRIAGGIAAQLKTAPPEASLADLQAELVTKGAGYLATVMPQTLAAAGATPASIEAMLHGEVGKQLVAAAPAILTAATQLLSAPPAAPAAG